MSEETDILISRLRENVRRVVLGQKEAVRLTVVALLAGEHLLLEDVPGVGKTLVGKAMARSVAGVFHRIQFTPDLLPADITGSSLYNARTQEFSFSPGPIFANIVLADEINRATPRTQSALLEAMSERQASIDGQTHPLPRPFMVIATQNPVEFEGTYPLPESQLDRFLLRIPMGYPTREVENGSADEPSAGRAGRLPGTGAGVRSRSSPCRRKSAASRSRSRSTATSWTSFRRRGIATSCTSARARGGRWRCIAPRRPPP